MNDKELEVFVEKVITRLMLKLKDQLGFVPAFKYCVTAELSDLVFRAACGEMDDNEAVEYLWDNVFDLTKYKPEGQWYIRDEDGSRPTSFGFIIAPDGVIYHLTDQYRHGAVMAALDPKHAMMKGYVHPTKLLDLGVHTYQDYELSGGGKELGYLRFGYGFYNRMAGDFSKATPEQLKQLKQYFQRFDMMDEELTTDRVIYNSGRDFVKDLDKMLFNAKMGNTNVEQDITLCKLHTPEDNPLGSFEE